LKPLASSKLVSHVGSSASEKVITRQRVANASTVGAIHSQRPWMPGMRTTGVPDPRSMMFISTIFTQNEPRSHEGTKVFDQISPCLRAFVVRDP
jgi:hypothetical protein